MSLSKGNLNIAEVYKGGLPIAEIYKGSDLVWKKADKFMLKQYLYLDGLPSGYSPRDVFFSQDGYCFVTCRDGALRVYDDDGVLKTTFNFKSSTNVGSGNTSSSWCNTIVGDSNNLYLNDHSSDKVYVLSYSGYTVTFNKIYNSGNKYIYSSYLYNGYLYQVNSERGKQKLIKMDVSTGNITTIYNCPFSNDYLMGLTLDEDTGNIYLIYQGGGDSSQYMSANIALIKLAPDGTVLKNVGLFNNPNLDNSLDNVEGICFDNNGYLYTCQRVSKRLDSVNQSIIGAQVWQGGTDIYDKNLNLVLKDTVANEPYLHDGTYMTVSRIRYNKYKNLLICFNDTSYGHLYSIPPYRFGQGA